MARCLPDVKQWQPYDMPEQNETWPGCSGPGLHLHRTVGELCNPTACLNGPLSGPLKKIKIKIKNPFQALAVVAQVAAVFAVDEKVRGSIPSQGMYGRNN